MSGAARVVGGAGCDAAAVKNFLSFHPPLRAIAHTLERLATDPALRQHLQYPITPRGGQRRGERRLQGMGLLTSAGLSLPFRGPLFVF